MPSSVYSLVGQTISEQLRPNFRKVDYHFEELDTDRAMMAMTTNMRALWLIQPQMTQNDQSNGESHKEAGIKAVERFVGPYSRQSKEEKALIPINPDRTSLHTAWREAVYHFLSCVFVDAYGFLETAAGPRYGHYHHPEHEMFAIDEHEILQKSWQTHVMLLPAYLAPGVTVRIIHVQNTGVVEEIGQFNDLEPFITWFVREGMMTRFVIERSGELVDGPAAVMLAGPACSEETLNA